jgi:predicted amidohydrolase
MLINRDRSVERGMRIEPPFDTALGKVASAICFDVKLHYALLKTLAASD